jgi:hypothetical protein
MKRILAIFLFFSILTPALPLQAAGFNPDFVITDSEATETSSYDADDIQAFLGAQGGALSSLSFTDIDGVVRRASDIIARAALRNVVSPRLLLALLQREQSLVTDPSPSQRDLDWATGYGVCDSCSTDDPSLAKFKGFANQVDGGAALLRYFIDNDGKLNGYRRASKTAVIDGVLVTPATRATASLYNYTPHLAAQQNLWTLWQRWFVRRYPSGSLVNAAPDIAGTWLIRYGERRLISSPTVLASRYDPKKVVKISANDLMAYPMGPDIKFANYSLLRSPGGTVYLIVDDERRGFVSKEVFRKLGFSASEVDDASWDDLNAYKEGAPITLAAAYPFGALLRNPENGGIYFVQNGVKRPLFGPELIKMYFGNRKVKKATVEELAGFKLGDPITLADGELVKTADNPAIYVISDGQRLPIVSADAFEKQGWKWENVRVVSEKVLSLNPLGQAFEQQPAGIEITND